MDKTNTDTEATPGPKTRIRLFLRASNLPKLIAQGYRQPDSLARVSVVTHRRNEDESTTQHVQDGTSAEEESGSQTFIDETEVVKKSSSPRWTVSFSVDYEFGSQLLFFVEVFAIRGSNDETDSEEIGSPSFLMASLGGKISKREVKLLGSAVFDVQDLLGTKSRVKARRLRKGGVIYAHIEQQTSDTVCSSIASTKETQTLAFRSSRRDAETSDNVSDTPMLSLRLRASSLVHTHSIHSKVSPKTVSRPDTYYEVARPSSSGWIVVYRSPLVKESITPTWDEAMIPLTSLHSNAQAATFQDGIDLNEYPVLITVYKSKKKKCKSIGAFETTVQALIDVSLAVTNESSESGAKSLPDELHYVTISGAEDRGKFSLRPNATGSEVTGLISILQARVGQDQESSQRFLNADSYDECSSITSMEEDGDSTLISSVTLSQATMYKFLDYANAGLDIDFCVAIDFTSSNGDPRIPGTLHYSRDGMMNDYEEAIESIGITIGKYSVSKQYPVWGFGAKYDGDVRHIFQCGQNPTANDIEGVLDAYRSVFETDLIMSGPTVISSVLRAAAARAKAFPQASLKYCILLILTDGIVADTDLKKTQQLIDSYKDLPLSIVMVGIGRTDFTEMHRWNCHPSDKRGKFTFVSYRQHQYDSTALSREALHRVPFEIRDYFVGKGVSPW